MIKTNFERLYHKGWLKSKTSMWRETDRFTAGQKLYFSYEKSQDYSVGVIDPTRLYVNSFSIEKGLGNFSQEKEKFIKAYGAVPIGLRKIIENLILKNIAPALNDKKEVAQYKEKLCLALDCLVCHYVRGNQK